MRKEQLIPVALPLLFSIVFGAALAFMVLLCTEKEEPVRPIIIVNDYARVTNHTETKSVNLECKKNVSIVEVLPDTIQHRKCSLGKTIILNKKALYVTIRIPQGQLIINLGK